MKTLGLILARGGSKRLPGKNLKELNGVSLLERAIRCGLDAKSISHVVVCTESMEIQMAAFKAGCKEVVERPDEMATDDATVYPSIEYILDGYDEYHALCLLQPTSPFRAPEDIDMCSRHLLDYPAVATAAFDKAVPNGAVYIGWASWLLGGGNFDNKSVGRKYMSAERSLDIDTQEDWDRAEQLIKEGKAE